MSSNQWGPVYQEMSGQVNNPVNTNVAESNPQPPAFDSDYGVNATSAFWWKQQGLIVPEAPDIISFPSSTFYLGKTNTFIVQASGNPVPLITCSTLPVGLTLTNNGNGLATLSGTPQVTGTFLITFTATNSDVFGSSSSQVFTLTIQSST